MVTHAIPRAPAFWQHAHQTARQWHKRFSENNRNMRYGWAWLMHPGIAVAPLCHLNGVAHKPPGNKTQKRRLTHGNPRALGLAL